MRRFHLAMGASVVAAGVVSFGAVPIASARAEAASEYIIQFVDGTDAQAEAARLEAAGIDVSITYDSVFPGVAVTATPSEIAAVRLDDQVEAVAADTILRASEQEQSVGAEAVQAGAPWGLDRIDQHDLPLSTTFEPPATGDGVKIYVLDSGIRLDHTEFTGRIGGGAYAYGSDTGDCNGHGTHVSGIAGGTTYGVAKLVRIVPVKVLGCDGSASTSTVIQGINWIINNHQAGTPAVLNASLGGDANSTVDTAFQRAIDDGITVVLAAGNGTMNVSGVPNGTPLDACTQSPARLPAAITVGATTSSDTTSSFSNYGTCVDVLAPGSAITSASFSGPSATTTMSGTSMAAPHVAGVAALLLTQQPLLTPAQVANEIVTDATMGKITNPGTGTPNRLLYTSVDAPPPPPPPPPPTFVPVSPARLLETRSGLSTADSQYNSIGRVPAGGVVALTTGGRGGVAADASAVALNVTVVSPSAAGFVTVFPCGSPVPNSSSVNFVAGATVANAVISKVGTNAQVCLFSNVAADLVVDVNGYFPAGSTFVPLVPGRFLETRDQATVDGLYAGIGPLQAGVVVSLPVAGRNTVAVDAAAVVTNVTVVSPSAAGFVTVFPCGSPVPNSSSVNFVSGATVANAVVSKVGTNGQICLFSNVATDLVVDVNGYFPAGSSFQSVVPARLLETRSGLSTVDGLFAGQGPVPATGVVQLTVANRGGVGVSANAVVLNVTVVQPTGAGFVTVYPCGGAVPNSSSVNFVAGATVANAVVAQVGAGGAVCLFSNVATHLVVDVNGWFATS